MKFRLLSLAVLAALSAPSFAHEAGDFIVRGGAAMVDPDSSSDNVAGLGEFDVDDNTQLGLNFTYMVTDNWGIELLAATPFKHDVSLPGISDLAEVTHLPPTLMAQYYFDLGKFRPYVGAGVNYTIFWDEDFKKQPLAPTELSDLELDDSIGFAAHVGLDYEINESWLVNASIWYIDINTDVEFKVDDAKMSIDTDIDPMVYMVSVGYRF